MQSPGSHGEVVASQINNVFQVNRTMALGASSTFGSHGSLGVMAPAPITDSPFTWGASTNAFTTMPHSSLKSYMGFKPTAKDKESAEILKGTLDLSAIVPIHPSAKKLGAHVRSGASHSALTTGHLDLAALKRYTGFVPTSKDRSTAEKFHLVTSAITPNYANTLLGLTGGDRFKK